MGVTASVTPVTPSDPRGPVGELQEKPKEFQGDADDRNSVARVTPKNEEGSNGTGLPNRAGEAQRRQPDECWPASSRREAATVEIARRPPSWPDARDMPHPVDRCHWANSSGRRNTL